MEQQLSAQAATIERLQTELHSAQQAAIVVPPEEMAGGEETDGLSATNVFAAEIAGAAAASAGVAARTLAKLSEQAALSTAAVSAEAASAEVASAAAANTAHNLLRKQLGEKERRVTELQEQLVSADAKCAAAVATCSTEEEVEGLTARAELEEENMLLRAEVQRLTVDVEQVEDELEAAVVARQELVQQVAELEQDLDEADVATLASAQEVSAAKEAAVAGLVEKLAGAEAAAAAAVDSAAVEMAAAAALEMKVEQMNSRLVVLNGQLKRLEAAVSQKDLAATELEEKLTSQLKQLEKAAAQKNHIARELEKKLLEMERAADIAQTEEELQAEVTAGREVSSSATDMVAAVIAGAAARSVPLALDVGDSNTGSSAVAELEAELVEAVEQIAGLSAVLDGQAARSHSSVGTDWQPVWMHLSDLVLKLHQREQQLAGEAPTKPVGMDDDSGTADTDSVAAEIAGAAAQTGMSAADGVDLQLLASQTSTIDQLRWELQEATTKMAAAADLELKAAATAAAKAKPLAALAGGIAGGPPTHTPFDWR